jgi:Fe-S cluster assembly iron-binding protein IscA
MIQVTEKASGVLLQALEAKADDETQGIRLTQVAGQGFGLGLDAEQEGDQVVEHQGRKVLLVDEALANQLEGAILDVVDSPRGPTLSIQMPETEA